MPKSTKLAAAQIQRSSLAELSFGDLLKVQQSVGSKTFQKLWNKKDSDTDAVTGGSV
eukprot:jgi/Hompol1/4193/HPOL_006978-RA